MHISIPLYSIFPKCGFFFWFVCFWLLFLFQRFVESTFFCRMYKYIIFVIVIIIILDNPIAVFIYFFFIFSVCLFFFFTYIYINISVSDVPSPVRCKVKYQVLFLWFGVKDLSRERTGVTTYRRYARNTTKLLSS